MTVVAITAANHPATTEAKAQSAVRARFVLVPSANNQPRFRDLITGIDQQGAYILQKYYRDHGGKEKSANDLLFTLPVVYGETFVPNAPPVVNGLLNLWTPPSLQPSGAVVSQADVPLFMEYMRRMFPVQEERLYFMQWLAHCIRYPDKRINATPVLRSDHGTGKGFLVKALIAPMLGKRSVAQCGLRAIVGAAFNDVLEGKTLVVIEEVYHSKKNTTDALKSLQGGDAISLNRKHKPAVMIDNYLNFIITSNDHIPLMIEESDRRNWFPQFIQHKESQLETAHFLSNLLAPWLDDGGLQLVRDYLEGIDLTTFDRHTTPTTESKRDMLGHSSQDKLLELLRGVMGEHPVLTTKVIKDSLYGEVDRVPSDVAIASALTSLGYRRRRLKAGKLWVRSDSPLLNEPDTKLLLETLPAVLVWKSL